MRLARLDTLRDHGKHDFVSNLVSVSGLGKYHIIGVKQSYIWLVIVEILVSGQSASQSVLCLRTENRS